MTAQSPHPAGDGDAKRTTSADAALGRQAPVAVSPAFGPLPPIYISQRPGEKGSLSLLRHAATAAVRRAVRGAVSRFPDHPAGTRGE